MDKTEAQSQLNKIVRSLKFNTISSVEIVEGSEARIVLKTKCHDLFFDDFEDKIYDLAEMAGKEFCSELTSKYFENGKYLGTIKRDKQGIDVGITNHVDIIHDTQDKTEPESLFIQVIITALRSDVLMVAGNTEKLKWKASARKLGYVIRVLSDLDLIDAPRVSDEINCKKLAEQTLGSFEVKSGVQTMRKSVDPDQNKLTKNEKMELFDQLKDAIDKFPEN